MNNYLPERIYNAIKDIPEYQEIDNKVNSLKNECKDIIDYLVSDDLISKELADDKIRMESIIAVNCPDYLLQYQSMQLSEKEDILSALEKAKRIDLETELYIYTELYSLYEDNYEDWMDIYIQKFEQYNCLESDMSSKMFLEYFIFCSHFYRKSMNTSPDMIKKFIDYLDQLADKVKNKISFDTLNHIYAQHVGLFISWMELKVNNDYLVAEYLKDYNLKLPSFQYEDFSYPIFELNDKVFDVFFATRDFENAYRVLNNNFQYLNYGLANKEQLLRGVNFYDYNYAIPLLSLMRKYYRISKLLPDAKFEFTNLSKKELDFISWDSNVIDKAEQKYGFNFFRGFTVQELYKRYFGYVSDIIDKNAENYEIFNAWIRNQIKNS